MKKREPKAVEDMAEYWINEILDHYEEPFSDEDQTHCLLFSLLYIGHTLNAIDTRLMNMENTLKSISVKLFEDAQ